MRGPAILVAAALPGAAPAGAAADGDLPARLAAQQRCEEALPLLRRSREQSPGDARLALLEGECLLHEQRYREAAASLAEAERLDPGSGDAALYLAMAHYHAGDLSAARAALERAGQRLPDSAALFLYRGLLLLDESRGAEAAPFFERAARLDPAGVEPAASYYAGLAHRAAGDRAAAERALRRVGELAPGSDWARRAAEILQRPPAPTLARWLVVQAGLDYDSNVALRGEDVAQPSNISDDDDGRGTWGAEAGAELLRGDLWGGGVAGHYSGAAYFEENDFDWQAIAVSAWLDRRLARRTFARVAPEFGASFLDYDDFARFYGVTADLLHDWDGAGSSRPFARYARDDFRYPIPGTGALRRQRNRDGHSLRAGYDHSLRLGRGTELGGGPYFLFYEAEGSEYDHLGGGAGLRVTQTLPADFAVEARGSFHVADYQDPSTFLLPGERVRDRRDHVGTVAVAVRRQLGERVSLALRWSFRSNGSNTRVFDYDRHIAGAFVTLALGR